MALKDTKAYVEVVETADFGKLPPDATRLSAWLECAAEVLDRTTAG